MVSYQCPNCGRVYNYGREINWGECMNCGYGLKKIEDITSIAYPELNTASNDKHTIGYTSSTTQSTNIPKCPTCQSTNIRKIGSVERGASIFMLGIFSKKINKTFKCNNCGYTW